jgi:cellulase/cellobiase CelA1
MLCVLVFVITLVIAISANPKYDVFEIVEIFESERVGNAKTKMQCLYKYTRGPTKY